MNIFFHSHSTASVPLLMPNFQQHSLNHSLSYVANKTSFKKKKVEDFVKICAVNNAIT
jgi:hypothetical protein